MEKPSSCLPWHLFSAIKPDVTKKNVLYTCSEDPWSCNVKCTLFHPGPHLLWMVLLAPHTHCQLEEPICSIKPERPGPQTHWDRCVFQGVVRREAKNQGQDRLARSQREGTQFPFPTSLEATSPENSDINRALLQLGALRRCWTGIPIIPTQLNAHPTQAGGPAFGRTIRFISPGNWGGGVSDASWLLQCAHCFYFGWLQ